MARTQKYPGIHLAAAKRVCRAIIRHNDYRPTMQGIFPEENGRYYCMADGYRAFRFDCNIEELEHPEGERYINCTTLIEKAISVHRDAIECIPSIDDLRAHIRDNKEENKSRKTVGLRPVCLGNYVYVNPQYLLDVLDVFPGVRFYLPRNNVSPVYFVADGGDGILMPVCPPKSKEEQEKDQKEKERIAAENDAKYRQRIQEEQEERRCANADTENVVTDAAEVLASRGEKYVLVNNKTLTSYPNIDDCYHVSEKCLVLRLSDRYNVNVPIRTAGWIAKYLSSVCANKGTDGVSSIKLWVSNEYKRKKAPDGVYKVLFAILAAIDSEAQEREAAENVDDTMTEEEIEMFFNGESPVFNSDTENAANGQSDDDFSDIDVDAVRKALEVAKQSSENSNFVKRVIDDVQAIYSQENMAGGHGIENVDTS